VLLMAAMRFLGASTMQTKNTMGLAPIGRVGRKKPRASRAVTDGGRGGWPPKAPPASSPSPPQEVLRQENASSMGLRSGE